MAQQLVLEQPFKMLLINILPNQNVLLDNRRNNHIWLYQYHANYFLPDEQFTMIGFDDAKIM